jgi:alpha-ketoglutarate-dependent taurine dioxygenase
MRQSRETETSDIYKKLASLSPEALELFELLLSKEGLNISESLIVPQKRESNIFSLSFAQQRLWFLDQLEPGSFAYNIPAAVRLRGALDVAALEQSLNEIVRRHEALRTTFHALEGKAVQVIAPSRPIALQLICLDELPEAEREAEAIRTTRAEARKPFDLSTGPLLRATLLRLDTEEHIILLTMHHIISDGWSMGILLDEVAVLYRAFSEGKPSPLPELPIQYIDFAQWQRRYLRGEVLDRHLAYWKRQLTEPLPVLQLPTDHRRPAVQTYQGAIQSITLSTELSEAIKTLSEREGATPFMTLLAAFKTLLYHYTGQDDIIVGTGIANRNRIETESLIGFFVNLLVLRTNLAGDPGFLELLQRVRKVTVEAYAHQDLPFDKLVEELQPKRDLSRTPLLQVVFVLQNTPRNSLTLPGLTVIPLELDGGTARFDLTIFVVHTELKLKMTMQYNTALFESRTITRMLDHYQTLLGSIVARPRAPISTLRLLDESEGKEKMFEREKYQTSGFERFKETKPKAINLSEEALIKTDYLQTGQTLPLVAHPLFDDLDLVDWASNNQVFIETHLLQHGAILFRGFNIESVAEFERFALSICPELFDENGELERTNISSRVYTPVNYPSDKSILWHNENSFCPRWPLKLWFFCIQPSLSGGETPIADSRRVFQLIRPEIREQFAKKKIMYLRNYHEGLGLSWQTVFQTTERAVVEEYCRKFDLDFEWKGTDHLTTRCVRPAVAKHPRTGEMVWFNQATHWHVSCLDEAARVSLLHLFSEEDLPRNAYYGDGSPIEDAVMNEICEAYRKTEVVFPWERGDILMLDNMLTAHARNPYAGRRQLAVAMGEMVSDTEI